MNRMQKIISRAKKEIDEGDNIVKIQNHQKQGAQQGKYEYRQTRIVRVNKQALKQNRVISLDKSDAQAIRFQVLRTKVLQKMRRNAWNTLGITAPVSGSGRSTVSANLACSLAMEGSQSVLLVDLDLGNPSIHQYFCLNPKYGIYDVFENEIDMAEALINPGIERLVILPAAKSTVNSSGQASTAKVIELISELKNRYSDRIVIFNLPPALVGDDVMVFAPYLDCSLLIVESGASKREEIEEAMNILKEKPILGTVLNKVMAST